MQERVECREAARQPPTNFTPKVATSVEKFNSLRMAAVSAAVRLLTPPATAVLRRKQRHGPREVKLIGHTVPALLFGFSYVYEYEDSLGVNVFVVFHHDPI